MSALEPLPTGPGLTRSVWPTRGSGRNICWEEGCARLVHARGCCLKHYKQWMRTLPRPATAVNRFLDQLEIVDLGYKTPCWLYTGACTHGYAVFWDGSRTTRGHQFAYEWWVGPIRDGLTLDHLCHSADPKCNASEDCTHRRCVNPDHLEAVTTRTNLLRGRGPSALAAKATHCPHGHPYDEANTYITPRGHRNCRICKVAAAYRHRARKASKGAA